MMLDSLKNRALLRWTLQVGLLTLVLAGIAWATIAVAQAEPAENGGTVGAYETGKGTQPDRLSITTHCIKQDGSRVNNLPELVKEAENRAENYGLKVYPLKTKTLEVELGEGGLSELGVFLKQIEKEAHTVCSKL